MRLMRSKAPSSHAEALRWLQKVIQKGITNSLAYDRLAYTQSFLNKNREAVQNYERAFEVGIPPGPTTRGVAYYNFACGYARLGNKEKALDAVAHALESGFSKKADYESDTNFAALCTEKRFQEIISRIPQ